MSPLEDALQNIARTYGWYCVFSRDRCGMYQDKPTADRDTMALLLELYGAVRISTYTGSSNIYFNLPIPTT